MVRLSTFLLPVCICIAIIVAYRPLLSPAEDWGMLHSDYSTFHSAACLKQRMSLPCLQWMIAGGAAQEFGVFEPVSWFFHSALLTLNNGFLTSHSWHVVSLFVHMLCSIVLFFAGEQLLALMDGRDPDNTRGLYRLPTFFSVLYWALSPQRVEAIAWASAYSVPWSALFGLVSMYCFVRSTRRDVPWRYFSWISYIAASWASALMLPLAFCYVLLDYVVILPQTRARLLAEAKAKGKTPGKSLTDVSPVLDAFNAGLRGTVFVLGWAIGWFLSSTAAFQSNAAASSSRSLSESFLLQIESHLEPSTLLSRLLRSIAAVGWYMKETVYPANLHLFQTRHVPLAEETLQRLALPQNQNELIDTVTVVGFLVILGACILARQQAVFAVSMGSFLLLLLPESGLFPSYTSSVTSTHTVYVADRWAYFAQAWIVPFAAWWIIKEDAGEIVQPANNESKDASVASKDGKKLPEGLKQRKAAAAASSSSTTPAAPSVPTVKRLPVSKQPLFTWLAPRLILTLTLLSICMFAFHLTPAEMEGYKTVQGNCARVLEFDPDIVACHELLGIHHFRSGSSPVQALKHLDRLEELESQSLVAYVCRGTILADPSPDAPRADLAASRRSFEHALSIQPHSPYVLTAWAKVMSGRNETLEAMTILERCVSYNPKYTEAYYLLSSLALANGDHHSSDAYKGQADMIESNLAYQRASGGRNIDVDSIQSVKEGLTRAPEAEQEEGSNAR